MKKSLILLVLAVLACLFGFLWWNNGTLPVNINDKKDNIFVIKKGESIREIGNSLKQEGFIRDPVVFFLYLRFISRDKAIQAGDYRISPSQTLSSIVDTLRHGTLDRWVTIREGLRAEEIAQIFKDNEFIKYDDSWIPIFVSDEGRLFPDTYLIPKDADVDLIISILKNNFTDKIKTIGLSEDDPKFNEIITVASIIEREAAGTKDMGLVASVIYNRLRIGMALQVDATVQYGLGYSPAQKTWWRKRLSNTELAMMSPYNTYKNPGLPPRPICSPGISAITAALAPSKSNYLYYVADSKGVSHFAATLEEHNRNIQKYLNN